MAAVTPFMGATLGCIVSQDGRLGFFASFASNKGAAYAVTCSHSLAPSYNSSVAKPTPDLPNGCPVYLPENSLGSEYIVGYSTWATSIETTTPVEYDCGIVRLSGTPSSSIGAVLINQKWLDTTLPSDLFLVVDTQLIHGSLLSQESTPEALSVTGRDGAFTYNNLYSVDYSQPGQTGPAIVEGMSGAPVITLEGFLVGMHVGGQNTRGYFHRADEILKWIGMDIYQS
jgi:hypothetical protein